MSGSRWTETRAAEWLHGPLEREIRNGAVYYLKCLGSLGGNRWLDGRTGDGTVGLAPVSTYPFTGTRWRVHKLRDSAWAFRCLGEVPGNRWLDGRTADATVGLASYPDHQFTGARWQPLPVRNGVYVLKCLGEIDGNRFLDGVTASATTGLAPHADYPYTGTHWELRRERWWVGCNFIPSTAVNQLEMWQQETFDPATIKRELAASPQSDFSVRLVDFGFSLSQPLKAGSRTLEVANQGSERHELVVVQLAPGASVKDFAAAFEPGASGPPPGKPIGGLTGIEPGHAGSVAVDLQPGQYGLICFMPDSKTSAPHFTRGMMLDVTLP